MYVTPMWTEVLVAIMMSSMPFKISILMLLRYSLLYSALATALLSRPALLKQN